MSKIALSGDANGNGTLTIASPNTNSDRTLTLPDSTGTIATAESTLAQFSASGSAPVYACRAWVNFNGTGTPAILASGNVSSITDNGTGDYNVNFTNAMPDANYSIGGMNGSWVQSYNTRATSSIRVTTYNSTTGTNQDMTSTSVHIFR